MPSSGRHGAAMGPPWGRHRERSRHPPGEPVMIARPAKPSADNRPGGLRITQGHGRKTVAAQRGLGVGSVRAAPPAPHSDGLPQ